MARLGHTLLLLPEVGASPPTRPTTSASALESPMLLSVALPMSAHLGANNEEISGQLFSLVASLPGHLQSQRRLPETLRASSHTGGAGVVGRSIISSGREHREQGSTCFSLQGTKSFGQRDDWKALDCFTGTETSVNVPTAAPLFLHVPCLT